MKALPAFFIMFVTVLILLSCTSNDESQNSPTTFVEQQVTTTSNNSGGIPITREELKQNILSKIEDLGIYDVIVTDVDGWDISLWQVRHRANRDVVSYYGIMGYYSGAHYYEGIAAGIWDYENNIFSCTCVDSSWNGGNINYVMTFEGYNDDGYVTLKGPYYYKENPNRLNRIYAWVYEGAFPYINTPLNNKLAKGTRRTAEEIAEYLSRPRKGKSSDLRNNK